MPRMSRPTSTMSKRTRWYAVVAALVLAASVELWAVSTTDLYAYWAFDTSPGIAEDSHSGNRDLTNGSGIGTTTGKLNEAANMDAGNLAFTRADEAAADFTTAFSVSCWIRGNGGIAVTSVIMSKWTYSSQGGWTLAIDGTDDLAFWVADSLTDGGSNNGVTTTASLVGDTWYHVVWVYDGGGSTNADRAKIYLNNSNMTLTFTGTIASSLQNNTADMVVGRWPGLDRYWVGRIDECGVWSRALSSGDVSDLYNSGNALAYSSFSGGGGGGTPKLLLLLGVGGN